MPRLHSLLQVSHIRRERIAGYIALREQRHTGCKKKEGPKKVGEEEEEEEEKKKKNTSPEK